MFLQIPQIRSHVPQFAFQMHVLSCNTHQILSCMPELLPYTHHNHENPTGGGSCARRFLGTGGGGGLIQQMHATVLVPVRAHSVHSVLFWNKFAGTGL